MFSVRPGITGLAQIQEIDMSTPDLLAKTDGRRIGFEFKFGDAPKLTKAMAVAVSDLKLEELIVVKPAGRDYAMAQGIQAMSLPSALSFCQSLRADRPERS